MPRDRVLGVLLLVGFGAGGTQGQTFRGTVVDAATRSPIAGTIIQAQSSRGNQPISTTSDSTGTFALSVPAAGLYTVAAAHIGYLPHRGDTIRIADAETIGLRIELDRNVLPLRPVVVTERVSWMPAGFEQRRSAGFGRFLTRTDIEKRRGFQTTDILRGMTGIVLTPARRGQPAGSILQMRGPGGLCQPAVWIDGLQLSDGGQSVDQVLTPGVLEAIEVYNSTANAPLQYRTGSCGVVLFWTRHGAPDDREKTRWWKLAAGAAAGLGLVLLLIKTEK
jgi:hypothetical protein